MGKIRQLDTITANSIAAGEVVERPASVVKELCENAMDAGASQITIEIHGGGIRSIQVTDNGSGMDAEDALNAFTAHATSKLRHITDLEDIASMGFRGEALPSIASVSMVTLKTRLIGESIGTKVKIVGGELEEHLPVGTAEGTSILIENLFFNVPARHKFLKKDSTEAARVTEVVNRLILARPDISFLLKKDNQLVLHSPGNDDLNAAVYTVFGRDISQSTIPLKQTDVANPVRVEGVIGRPSIARRSRSQQMIFVNGRAVQSPMISKAIDEGYKGLLMKGEFAFAVIMLNISSTLVDVNVHPQKLEVRFWNEAQVFSAVHHAIKDSLYANLEIKQEEEFVEPEIIPIPTNTYVADRVTDVIAEPKLIEPMPPREMPSIFDVRDTYDVAPIQEQPVERPLDLEKRVDEKPVQEFVIPPQLTEERVEEETVKAPRNADLLPLLDARLAGILFRTYIILEHDDAYTLIDQHAAHERILFEKFLAQAASGQPHASQALLAPEVMHLSLSELDILERESDFFRELGFDYDRFGERQIALRAVPQSTVGQHASTTLKEALDQILEDGANFGLKSNREAVYLAIATAACKAAIKAHDKITDMEVHQLVRDLIDLDNPYQCPHGRPVLIRSSQKELEKRFRRIV